VEKDKVMEKCQESFTYLLVNNFIQKSDDGFIPTFLGKMTALFYIQPETALHFKNVEKMFYRNNNMDDLELVANLLNTDEFLDNIRVEERDAKLIDLCNLCFRDNKIQNRALYEERIMKAIPMIFVDYFNKTYNTRIIMYRTDTIELANIMDRLMASAEVIIYDKKLKQRIKDLSTMIKNKTLDKDVAILRNIKGLGNVRVNRLFLAGIKKPEHFLRTPNKKLMEIMKVSQTVLDDIKENLKERLKEDEGV
jgi:replicative superfamily II helicase